MKSSPFFLFIAGSFSSVVSPLAGEGSIARDLVHEAALADIENDSSKSALTSVPAHPFSGWRLSLSPSLSYQRFGRVRINGGARNDSSMLPSLLGSSSEKLPDIGSTGIFGERSYDDGFVNQTGPTPDTGRTWFWGYDNDSQINNAGDLVMSATGTRQDFQESYHNPGSGSSSKTLDGITPRFDLTLTPPPGIKRPFQNILVSFAYFADEASGDFTSFTGEQTLDQYRLDFQDTFTTSGLFLPGAGYGGTFLGPGVTIPNLPGERATSETLTGTEVATLRNEVSLDFSLDSFSLAIGPTFEGAFAPGWEWQGSFGPTLNFHRYSLRQNEQVYGTVGGVRTPVGAGFRNSESGSEFGLGLFLRGKVIHQLTENWNLDTYLQAEIAESFRVSNDVSSFKIEPSGYSIGIGLARSF